MLRRTGVGWGGVGDDDVPCTLTHLWCYGELGWGGVGDVDFPSTWTHLWCYGDDDVLCTLTHLWCYGDGDVLCTLTHLWCYGELGWGGVGLGMLTFLAHEHIFDATEMMTFLAHEHIFDATEMMTFHAKKPPESFANKTDQKDRKKREKKAWSEPHMQIHCKKQWIWRKNAIWGARLRVFAQVDNLTTNAIC